MQRLPAEQSPAPLPIVRVDRCYVETQCGWDRCSGRGVQFAVDLQRGWTLGHYCDLHSPAQIVAYWTAMLDQPLAPPPPSPPTDTSDSLIETFFGAMGVRFVDVTPDGDAELPDDEDAEGEGDEEEEDEEDDSEDEPDTEPQAIAVRLPMPAAITPPALARWGAER